MHTHITTAIKTYVADGPMGLHLRVKRNTNGRLILAGTNDRELGTLERRSLAENDDVPVRLRTAVGTSVFIATDAIERGATVFAATGGRVGSTGTVEIGTAETESGLNGDYIEVLRF